MKILIIVALFVSVNALPINTCARQSECLSVNISDCNAIDYRTVCLEWNDGPGCSKRNENSTVSYACPGDQGPKTGNWNSNDPICVTVMSGDTAHFGVKDGGECALPGWYPLDGLTDSAECTGPGNFCEGSNDKGCQWHIPTDDCLAPAPSPDVCPTLCYAQIPCPTF